jgi:hypothetical protein
MSKHFITITDENLYNEIVEYCSLNNEKVNVFCQRILKEQLLIEKYGDTTFGRITHEIEIPPVVPNDSNAKNKIQPHIDNIVEEYTKTINDKIIDEIKNNDISKKKIRRL